MVEEVVLGDDVVNEVIARKGYSKKIDLVRFCYRLPASGADEEELSQIGDMRVEQVC